jgi:hypothetical protein
LKSFPSSQQKNRYCQNSSKKTNFSFSLSLNLLSIFSLSVFNCPIYIWIKRDQVWSEFERKKGSVYSFSVIFEENIFDMCQVFFWKERFVWKVCTSKTFSSTWYQNEKKRWVFSKLDKLIIFFSLNKLSNTHFRLTASVQDLFKFPKKFGTWKLYTMLYL